MNNIFDVAIIGGGPAGMMAGISAKNSENKVCILEKNSSLGRKLLLTGKGRCNFTTSKEIPEIVEAFGNQGKFLYGALTKFSNKDLINFFENRKVKTKIERGSRVFPESNKSITILKCLENELKKKKVNLYFNFNVEIIAKKSNYFYISSKSQTIKANKIIIATGGKSYPETGSTGDGYKFARILGHKIIKAKPALVGLVVKNKSINSLAGLSLKNISIYFSTDSKPFIKEFGEMLFTHKGISGPCVLRTSKDVYENLKNQKKVFAKIDLKPSLDQKQLKQRIHREISKSPKKEYQSLLKTLLPRLLINYAIYKTSINKHKKTSQLNKSEIQKLIEFLKDLRFKIHAVEPLEKAIVTNGGIDINEIDSKNMQSKKVKNLFFAGEIISLVGPTGGYNLQKAFSTGWIAGKSGSSCTFGNTRSSSFRFRYN